LPVQRNCHFEIELGVVRGCVQCLAIKACGLLRLARFKSLVPLGSLAHGQSAIMLVLERLTVLCQLPGGGLVLSETAKHPGELKLNFSPGGSQCKLALAFCLCPLSVRR